MELKWSRLTRKQAEIAAGVSRATLYRRIEDGTLSAEKDERGENRFDAAELVRVFPQTFDRTRLETDDEAGPRETVRLAETAESGVDTGENFSTRLAVIEVEKRFIADERDQLRDRVNRLEADLDHERREGREERKRMDGERRTYLETIKSQQDRIMLLTDQRPAEAQSPPQSKRFGVFARLFVAVLVIGTTLAVLHVTGVVPQ